MKISIRAARVNAGLSQLKVYEQLGIARSTLTRWERYETSPSKRNKKLLCKLYGVSPDEVIWEKQKSRMPKHPAQEESKQIAMCAGSGQ